MNLFRGCLKNMFVSIFSVILGFTFLVTCDAKREIVNVAGFNPAHVPLRVCYFTTWARYRTLPFSHKPRHVDPRLCSHIIVAFVSIKKGKLTFHSETEDKRVIRNLLTWKKDYPNLKVLVAVGGWTFGSIPFRQVVGSKENRTRFVESSATFLEKWKVDGLDMDWEFPRSQERNNFTLLLQEMKLKFQSKSNSLPFLLTAAVPCTVTKLGGYDIPAVQSLFDFISVMCYDFNGPWANVTGLNAPLNSWDGNNVAAGVNEWIRRGMPSRKVILGLPMYGHSFELSNPNIYEIGAVSIRGVSGPITKSPGFFSYYEVCEFLSWNGTEVFWNNLGAVPYAVSGNVWLSYDNEDSLIKKVEWAQNRELGGVMIWSLAMDDFTGLACQHNVTYPMLKAINMALGFNKYQLGEEKEATEIQNMILSNQVKKKALNRKSSPKGNSQNRGSKTGELCDYDHIPRPGKDCRHFTVCSNGEISTFLCPSGLVFSPENAICMWGWEVPECSDEAEHLDTTTGPPTTPPTNEAKIPPKGSF